MKLHPKVKWAAIAGGFSVGLVGLLDVAVTSPNPVVASVISAFLAFLGGYLKSSSK